MFKLENWQLWVGLRLIAGRLCIFLGERRCTEIEITAETSAVGSFEVRGSRGKKGRIAMVLGGGHCARVGFASNDWRGIDSDSTKRECQVSGTRLKNEAAAWRRETPHCCGASNSWV